MSRHMTPIPVEKRFIICMETPNICYLGVRAAMPSSTTAAQRPRQQTAPDIGRRQPLVRSRGGWHQQQQIWHLFC